VGTHDDSPFFPFTISIHIPILYPSKNQILPIFFPYSSHFWFPHVRPTGAPGLGAPVAPRVLTPPAPHRGAGLGANAAECRGENGDFSLSQRVEETPVKHGRKQVKTRQNDALVDGLEPWNFMTFHILGRILPTDFHSFQDG